MANTSISLTSLDYDTLKDDFIAFLRSQDQFKDYDFSGSNINQLIRVMAHNTFKNSFYLNMIASEQFLDSAQLISSVRSHAKELNYVPRSARSAKAVINMTFGTNANVAGSDTIVIPKGTGFSAVSNFRTYIFTVPNNITVSSSNNYFEINNLDIFEGTYVSDSFVVDYNKEGQRFIISNDMVDTDSLTVTVIEDDGLSIHNYIKKSTLLDLTPLSKVYFLQSGPKESYEIVFGDDVLGRKPKNGAVVILEYRVSAGIKPNGAVKFSLADDFGNGAINTDVTITTVERARDGALPEDIESIRYNAPRHFQVQERAVTTTDYEVILKSAFPEINTVSVYGGEEVSPPRFGKVFVAVDINNVDGLPDAKKLEYYAFLKKRSPLSIDPIFVEPEFLYYTLSSIVRYNINLTTIGPEDIESLVVDAIAEYNNTFLDDFKTTLRYSKLINKIDNAHISIVSNETEIQVYKKFNPTPGQYQNFYFNFGIPLYAKDEDHHSTHEVRSTHTVKSSLFKYNGELVYFEDDGFGKIYVVNQVSEGSHKLIKQIGTVDYETGYIKILDFICDSFTGSAMKIYCKPRSRDISSSMNQILTTETDEIFIDVEKIRE